MNVSNKDLGEDLRVIFERVFYHVVRQSFDDDIMETLVTRTIEMVNSDEDVQVVLQRIDNDIKDLINDADLEGFDDYR